MNDAEKQSLFENTARALADAPDFIKQRHVDNCKKCHQDYASGLSDALCRLNPSAAFPAVDNK